MGRKAKRISMPSIADFAADYAPNPSVFRKDDARTHRLKEIIAGELSETDRRVILLYAETGSVRETARLLGVSKSTMALRVKQIKEDIIKRL